MLRAEPVAAALRACSREVRELGFGRSVPRVPAEELTAAVFLREYVAPGRPVIVTGAVDAWPALHRWADGAHLAAALGAARCCRVAFAPDGRADAVVGGASGWPAPAGSPAAAPGAEAVFALPEERHLSMAEFLTVLRSSRSDPRLGVPYLSGQNGNLGTELRPLLRDVGPEPAWAVEALGGGPPDAINLWIGDERSTTTCHKDNYENLMVVIRGTKHFTLLPPQDAHRLHAQDYPAARYAQRGGPAGPWALERCGAGAAAEPAPGAGASGDSLSADGPDRHAAAAAAAEGPAHVRWIGLDPEAPPGSALEARQRELYPRYYARDSDGPAAGGPAAGPAPASGTGGRAPAPADGAAAAAAAADADADDPLAPCRCDVHAGELLYLPALVYHHVRQTPGPEGRAIAVNFWHDMAFDGRYAGQQLGEALAALLDGAGAPAGAEGAAAGCGEGGGGGYDPGIGVE